MFCSSFKSVLLLVFKLSFLRRILANFVDDQWSGWNIVEIYILNQT